MTMGGCRAESARASTPMGCAIGLSTPHRPPASHHVADGPPRLQAALLLKFLQHWGELRVQIYGSSAIMENGTCCRSSARQLKFGW